MVVHQKHFASPRALSTWMREHLANSSRHNQHYLWDRQGTDSGINMLENGSDRNVERAKALLQNFQENLEVPTLAWEHSMAGAFPDVGGYLAGRPDSMWRMQQVQSERTPLHIWVGVASSAGISNEDLVVRGCTLAAFALAMSSIRPVFISPYSAMGDSFGSEGSFVSWDVQTSPLVLSELLACLTEPHVVRYAGLAACAMLNPRAPAGWHPDERNDEAMKRRLGAQPGDLHLMGLHLRDELLTNPIKWVKAALKRYSQDIDA